MHHRNANQRHIGTAGFRLDDRRIARYQINTPCIECIITSFDLHSRTAQIPGFGNIYRNGGTSRANAHRLGSDPAGMLRLQVDSSRFISVLPGCLQGTGPRHRH